MCVSLCIEVSYPWGSIDWSTLLLQHVCNAHMPFLSNQVQRCQPILHNQDIRGILNASFPFLVLYSSNTSQFSLVFYLFSLWRRSNTNSSKLKECITLLPKLTLACLEMSSATISGCPSCDARWSGVMPCSDSELALAPYCSRLLATSSWFCLAAICKAVYPFCQMEEN